jgi:hypothetical protein
MPDMNANSEGQMPAATSNGLNSIVSAQFCAYLSKLILLHKYFSVSLPDRNFAHIDLIYARKEVFKTYLHPQQSDTLYLTQQQLEKYQVIYNEQTKKLQTKSGDNNALVQLDTTDQVCKAGDGHVAWAMDINGNLYVHPHQSKLADWA